jgi:PTS system galactitol-specific IIB component
LSLARSRRSSPSGRIEVVTSQCKATEVPSKVAGNDLVVTTTQVSDTGDVPVIYTVSFLTGVGI